MRYNKNYKNLTKKQIATELYAIANCYEKVGWQTIYRNMFYSKNSNCYKYIGRAHDYSF